MPARTRRGQGRPELPYPDGWTRHAVPSVETPAAGDGARELWAILALPLLIQVPGFAILWALLP